MPRLSHLLWPLFFVSTAAAHAQDQEAAPTPDSEVVAPSESPLDPQASDESSADEAEDVGSSTLARASKKSAVEAFVDYSFYSSRTQSFNPLALGIRGYWFHTPVLKYGFSLASEQFVFNSDRVATVSVTGDSTFRDVDLKGTAIRYAAHAQYFVSDTVHTDFSLFGTNGKTEKKDDLKGQNYSRSGLTIALGNQWSWDRYSFRWDWLTLTYNFNFDIGSENVLDRHPSNQLGGMFIVSGLAFGAEF
ncbi:MAG: hypothetical protein EOP09_06820 [Proteobacteria bacterium]|nr:MAG: hypothetical protein EOP09_06820 [Pseudomonadota bacterium]